MKILIVDDSARMRNMIKSMVRLKQKPQDTLEFFECSDGTDAINEYEKIHPDWLLMDIAMKNMNGLDASAIIKKRFPEAKIIIITNYDDAQFRLRALQSGIVHYILKENLNQIQEIINEPNLKRTF
ncbi:MAG: HlyD family type I secretion membrane fusion protein [Stygiobacter sp.]|nr:MAG: HlyD family type I secretion membrane fusion protein [Stygiobacter sp.]KAF0214696.1 MAG: HlyD family type I secretion membrane fusion [Ignavibacteria bacterium]